MDSTLTSALEQLMTHQLQGPLREFAPERLIDLRVTVGDLADESFTGDEQLEAQEADQSADTSRFSARTRALLRLPERRVLLSGISGAGKTFALGRFAYQLSQEALSEISMGREPAFIPLWEPATRIPDSSVGPVEWLSRVLQLRAGIFQESTTVASALFESGRLVLLIDSIHEVIGVSPGRTSNLKMLASVPKTRILASARPGYELPNEELRYDVLVLQGLSPSERERLIQMGGLTAETSEVLRRLALEPRLRRAVEVPQIWQMAIALALDGEDLSDVRQEVVLYERFLEAAFKRWRPGPTEPRSEEIKIILELIGAASVFRGGQDVPWSKALKLVQRWTEYRGRGLGLSYDQMWPSLVLDSLPRLFHPVLRSGTGEKALGFAHGSLADFLSAKWLLGVSRTLPKDCLRFPSLADSMSFALELLERRGMAPDVLMELDLEILQSGSPDLVLSWLHRVEKTRIAGVSEAIRDRVRVAASRSSSEARLLILGLRARGSAWALRLLSPLSNHTEIAVEIARLFPKRKVVPRIPRIARDRRNLPQKDLPPLEAPVSPLEDLRTQLESEIPEQREIAARTLGLVGNRQAVEWLLPLLSPTNEAHPEVRRRVATALGRLGDKAVVPDLVLSLDRKNEPDGEVRGKAARALGFLADDGAVAALMVCIGEDPDEVVRGSAISALGRIADLSSLDALIERLDPEIEPDPLNRSAAASALGRLGDYRAVEGLIEHLSSEEELNPAVHGATLAALEAILDLEPGRTPTEVLLALLTTGKSARIRRKSASLLSQRGEPPIIPHLLARLDPNEEPDASVRGSVATALGRLGDPRAVGPLLLRLDPEQEPGGDVRASAATALGILGDLRAVPHLLIRVDFRQESRADVRGSAATALGRLGDPRSIEPLCAMLDPAQEPDPISRGSAATALGLLGEIGAVQPLIERLDPEREESDAVRGSAVTALGRLGDLRAVKPICACLNLEQSEPRVRGSAATALGNLGDLSAVEFLLTRLDSENEASKAVRGSAAAALGKLGDLRAVGALLSRLDPGKEPDSRVRGSIVKALGYLGDPRAVGALVSCLDRQKERSFKVRSSAAVALGRIGGPEAEESLRRQLLMPEQGGAANPIFRSLVSGALRALSRRRGAAINPLEADALRREWQELLEDFLFQTQSPPPKYFARLLELSLRAIERHAGGGVSRGWKERDFERLLATLLGRDESIQVVSQAEPADRQRLDLLLLSRNRERVVIELKLGTSDNIDDYVHQTASYVKSLSTTGMLVAGHLVLLDISAYPSWNDSGRHTVKNGIEVWQVHVNRQPPSNPVRLRESDAT